MENEYLDKAFHASIWGLVGALSGVGSYLNNVLNKKDIRICLINMLARGFVGCVVGFTLGWIVDLKLGADWAVPASSIGAWFATETMNMLQKFIKKSDGEE
jgi:hypothetical protein